MPGGHISIWKLKYGSELFISNQLQDRLAKRKHCLNHRIDSNQLIKEISFYAFSWHQLFLETDTPLLRNFLSVKNCWICYIWIKFSTQYSWWAWLKVWVCAKIRFIVSNIMKYHNVQNRKQNTNFTNPNTCLCICVSLYVRLCRCLYTIQLEAIFAALSMPVLKLVLHVKDCSLPILSTACRELVSCPTRLFPR